MVFDVDCITFDISLNGFIEFACFCLWICAFELGPTGEKLARKHWNSRCLFAGQTIASAALRWDHYLFRLTRRCGLQVKRKKIEPCSRIFPCWLTLAAAPWVSRTACSCLFRKSYRFPATFNSKRNTSQSEQTGNNCLLELKVAGNRWLFMKDPVEGNNIITPLATREPQLPQLPQLPNNDTFA